MLGLGHKTWRSRKFPRPPEGQVPNPPERGFLFHFNYNLSSESLSDGQDEAYEGIKGFC